MSFVANNEERDAVLQHVRKNGISISMSIRSAVRWYFRLEE